MLRRILFSLITMMVFMVNSMTAGNKFTLVIDAGHGGNDYGAPGAVSYEKDLTLRMALAFGKMVERNCPDVRVIYTRKTDVFIPLNERANIANRNKADLFISVHINALDGGKLARGFQTYTLGKGTGNGISTNLDVAKRENSVIFLEKDYKQTYQGFDPNSPESSIMFEFIQDNNMEHSVFLAKMMQKAVCAATDRQNMGVHQANLAVLRLSSMPGCLVELGFISTPDEETFLNSADAPNQYAKGLFNAFMEYRAKYDDKIVVPYKAIADTEPVDIPKVVPDTDSTENTKIKKSKAKSDDSVIAERKVETPKTESPKEIAAVSGNPVFKVQILVSSRKLRNDDAHFKGVTEIDSYEENNMYKYTIGSSEDYNEIFRLRKQVLDKFPEAFIIAFKDSQRYDVNKAIGEFKKNKNK